MAEIRKPNMSAIWADAGAVIAPNDTKLRLGWTAEVPPHQWENFIQNRQDKAIAYIFQMGIPQWDETTEYFADKSVVVHNGRLYIAKASNTNSRPSVSAANWKLALDVDKLASIERGAEVNKVNSVAGKVGVVVLDKSDVGLSNVDNTSDLDKPISTATQSALKVKAPSSHVGSTGSAHGVATTSRAGFMSSTDKAKLDGIASGAQVNTVTSVAGKTGAVTVTKSDVGLSNVDNTSDANKPVSTATESALGLKANIDSPKFTGTISGITKSMVGLSRVDNTSDAKKPVSTAQASALDKKVDKANNLSDLQDAATARSNLGLGDAARLSEPNDFSYIPTVQGAPIVESGSNSDGHWIRWADGTQQCSASCMGGNYNSLGTAYPYPSPFVEISHTFVQDAFNGSDFNIWVYQVGDMHLHNWFIRGLVVNSTTADAENNVAGRRLRLLATGRWK